MFIGNAMTGRIRERRIAALAVFLFFSLFLFIPLRAQEIDTNQLPKLHISKIAPAPFHPTCNLDSNSVGFYFFPPNLGAEWNMQTVSQVLDMQNQLVRSDTTYSFEKVISDSNRTLQGLPVLTCESVFPYHKGGEDSAKKTIVEYYVDDSVVMTVFNHSITSELNHVLLVNPLDSGASWKDVSEDTNRTVILSTDEAVSTAMADFPHSLVIQTPAGFGMMSKYFVKGVGIVKVVFRGLGPQNGTFVVTSELTHLDRGDPKRNIKYRFLASNAESKKKKRHKK